ncbi:MAG: malate dehydrogenase [Sulfobacillus sp.]
MTKRPKVTLVGAGNVGATTGMWLMARNLCDLVLFDVVEGWPQGKALDLAEAAPIFGHTVSVTGTNDFAETAGSDVLVVTAGSPRRPGMTRDDLLKVNNDVISDVVSRAVAVSPEAVVIVVTNPVDVMTFVAQRASGLPHQRVFGMAGGLDSARFRTFLAWELGVSAKDVFGFVMGGHGDQMVPLVRYSTVGGEPVEKRLSKEAIDRIVTRTRGGGGEILQLLKNGSAFVAPAAATAEMVEAVLLDQRRTIPVVAYLNGEYGQQGVYVGVPAVIGKGGVEQVVEIDLQPDEQAAFDASVAAVRGPLAVLGF